MKQALKNNQKPNGIAKPQAPDVKTIPVPQPKKQEAAKPTLEDRIQRVEELRSLTYKRQRTIDILHQLRNFQFASDDNCVLTLADGQGQKFNTNNSNLIALLRDYFTTLLNDKISALDDEIMKFEL